MTAIIWTISFLAILGTQVGAVYLPYSCSFERRNLCGMSHDLVHSDFRWTIDSYGTYTSGTGPSSAYSGYYYMYISARNKAPGDKAYLRTPALQYTGQICITFFYNMYDSSRQQMGTMKVFSSSQGEQCPLVSLTGHQERLWRKANIPTFISAGDRIVFLGIRGNGTKGDIAIDSLKIKEGTCVSANFKPHCDAPIPTGKMNISLIISAQSKKYVFYPTTSYNNVSVVKTIQGDPSTWVPEYENENETVALDSVTRNSIRNIRKMGVDFISRSIVWNDPSYGAVMFGTIDTDVADIFIATRTAHYFASAVVGSLAIDWAAKNLYWTDKVFKWVMMTKLKNGTSEYYTVISTQIDVPSAVCVHPAKSFLFWTDISKSSPKIERTNMLGQERRVIMNSTIKSPALLDIDYLTDRLYWADTDVNAIESCLLDGTDRQQMIGSDYVSSFVGLTIYKNYLFAVDNGNQLYVYDTSTKTFERNMTMDYDKAFDIVAFGEDKQTNLTSPCQNTECDGICVGKENNQKAECICPDGKELYNKKSCLESHYYYSPVYVLAASHGICLVDVFTPETYDARKTSYYHNFNLMNCRDRILPGYIDVQCLGHLFSDNILYMGTSRNIHMRSMRNSARTYLLISGAGNVKAISVDWVSKNIYWVDSAGFIKVATYKGKYRIVVYKDTGASSLVVDPTTGNMYWTNPVQGWIARGSMDGDEKFKTINTHVNKPGNITMDYAEQRIYWTDAADSKIYSMNTQGKDVKTILSASHPYTIAIYKNHVAWTTHKQINWGYINQNFNTNATRHYEQSYYQYDSVMLYGEYSQPKISNNNYKCAVNNGGCGHICLRSNHGQHSCKCALGYDLGTDKKSCVMKDIGEVDMIVSSLAESKIIAVNSGTQKVVTLPLKNVVQPSYVDVDEYQKLLFWIDTSKHEISKATLKGEKQTAIWKSPQGKVSYGLAIDPVRKLIFYGIFNSSISSMDYNGKNNDVHIWSAMEEGPISIVLDILKGLIYWNNWGKFPGISVAGYDGMNHRILADGINILYPTGLYLDTKAQLLYWCDSWMGRIESITTQGTNRQLLQYNPHHSYFALTSIGNDLYATDQNSSYIRKISKQSGSPVKSLGKIMLPSGSGIVAFKLSSILPKLPKTTPTTSTTVATDPPGKGMGQQTGSVEIPPIIAGNITEAQPDTHVQEDGSMDTKYIIVICVCCFVVFVMVVAIVFVRCVRSNRNGNSVRTMSRADSIRSDTRDTKDNIYE